MKEGKNLDYTSKCQLLKLHQWPCQDLVHCKSKWCILWELRDCFGYSNFHTFYGNLLLLSDKTIFVFDLWIICMLFCLVNTFLVQILFMLMMVAVFKRKYVALFEMENTCGHVARNLAYANYARVGRKKYASLTCEKLFVCENLKFMFK